MAANDFDQCLCEECTTPYTVVENIELEYEDVPDMPDMSDMCGDCCEETVEDTIAFVLDDIITTIIQKGT